MKNYQGDPVISGVSEELNAALSSSNPQSHAPLGRGVWFMLAVESGRTSVTFYCKRRIAQRTEETHRSALHKKLLQSSYFQGRIVL